MGIQVMHFTGSEIHRDAAKCAREVMAYINMRGDEAMQCLQPGLWAKLRALAAGPRS